MTVRQSIALFIFVISMLVLGINVVNAEPFENLTDDTVLVEVLGHKVCLKDIEPNPDEKKKHRESEAGDRFNLWLKQSRESKLGRFFKPLWDEYTKEKGINVTEQEIKEFKEHMRTFWSSENQRRKTERDNFAKELIAENLEADKKAELEKNCNMYSHLLEIAPDPNRMYRSSNDVCKSVILSWKIKRELYNQYKGRVIFQQAGPEPLDAFRLFFEEQQSKGNFKFYNKDAEDLFWDYYRNVKHTVYKGPNEAEQIINTPWWLKEKDENYYERDNIWGDEVNGLQIRINSSRRSRKFTSDNIPVFTMDLLNTSDKTLGCVALEQFCEVEVDGKWYKWNGPTSIDISFAGFQPKTVKYDFLKIKLDENWVLKEPLMQKDKRQNINLSLGTHNIRVKYKTMHTRDCPAIEAISNSLKFQIIPPRKKNKNL
ncbi:MAG: hypothetical protein JXB29_00405 [Sedimentisphaerales bacterium]|nr:hypothetical protein [Sedimentisphaerales bacterium]